MPPKLTTEEFVRRAIQIHNNVYDYSLVNYDGFHTNVKIICHTHGVFEQIPGNHLKGRGCFKCNRGIKDLEGFIEKAILVHNNIYDYSETNYEHSQKKIKIKCSDHGVFFQRPSGHLRGNGCPKCKKNKLSSSFSKNLNDFIKEARKIHGNKFNYQKSIYINNKTPLTILCPKHNEIKTTPSYHLKTNGYGCPNCGNEAVAKKQTKTVEEFLKEASVIHNNIYDYSYVNYQNTGTKIKIICYKHGSFLQSPEKHLVGQGCPNCRESKGEKLISNFLITHNFVFERQKTFPNCKFIKPLYFDFYLPSHNLCIEFDGIQHQTGWWRKKEQQEESLKIIKKRDRVKDQYCQNNNIDLCRIPHDQIKMIDEILTELLLTDNLINNSIL